MLNNFYRPRVIALVGLALLLTPPTSRADVILVGSLDDAVNGDAQCSLREAVQAANSDSVVGGCAAGLGDDLVWIVAAGTLDLTGGSLLVTDELHVIGSPDLVIDAGHRSRIFRVAMTNPMDDFTLQGEGTTLRRGRSTGSSGGAIRVEEADQVTIQDTVFEENEACSELVNGACSFTPSFSGNGGGLYVMKDVNELTVMGSTFRRNVAAQRGGAIHVYTFDPVAAYQTVDIALADSTFFGNRVLASRGDGGDGSAVSLWASGAGVGTIDRCFFAFNGPLETLTSAPAGIPLGIRSSMFVDNEGWGIESIANLELSYVTIARNGGPGVSLYSSAVAEAKGSIITENGSIDCLDELTSLGGNFDGDGSCGFDGPADLPPGAAGLSGVGDWLGTGPIAMPPVSWWGVDQAGRPDCAGVDGAEVGFDLRNEPKPVDGPGGFSFGCDPGAIEIQADDTFLFADGFETGDVSVWSAP